MERLKEVIARIKEPYVYVAYDGCHKIYIINDDNEYRQACETGYIVYAYATKEAYQRIKSLYNNSCSLRFINTWSLETVIPQSF